MNSSFNKRSLLILIGSALPAGLAAVLWFILGKSWTQLPAFPFARTGTL